MVETNNLVKKTLVLILGIFFLISLVSAATQGRVVYTTSTTSIVVNASINSSDFWDGLDDPSDIDLNDLGDVNAGAPADQDALTWDDGSSKWIPQAIAALSKWIVSLTNGYLYNSSNTIYFNDTRLNLTIDARDTNCTDDQSCPLIIYDSDLPLANLTTPYCGNITGNATDLCTITPGGSDTWGANYTNYYNKSQIDDNLSLYILDSSLPLENQTIPHCSNITGNASDLCTITPGGGADGNASSICNNNEVLLGDGSCYDLGYIQNSTNVTNHSIYIQLSDLTDQTFASANVRQAINLSTEDESYGLIHSTGANNSQITIVTSGVYTIIAQPQVATGAGGAGKFHMWLEKYNTTNWVNVSNSNVELVLANNEENVIPLIVILKLNASEKVRLMGSVSDTNIKLDAQSPSGEPDIPSIIFSMFITGPTEFTDTTYINLSEFDWDVVFNNTFDQRDAITNSSLAIWIDGLFVRFTEVVGLVGNWTLDKINYYNKSQIDNNLSLYILDSSLPLANLTTPYCGNITGNATDLCTITSSGTDTNATTECDGTTTYLDGDGNCDDISSVYEAEAHCDEHDGQYLDCNGEELDVNAVDLCAYCGLADTNANTECVGDDVYYSGEGNCNTVIDTDTNESNQINNLNDSWLSTYNETYNAYLDSNNTLATWVDSLFIRFTEVVGLVGNWTLDKINYLNNSEVNTTIRIEGLLLGFNSTYNATYDANIDTNESDQINNLNDSWLSTYNATYDGLISNASYLSTYNATYAGYSANLSEDEVEAYILDNDNTANLDLNGYNITTNYVQLEDISGACDISTSGSICMNATGVYIVG